MHKVQWFGLGVKRCSHLNAALGDKRNRMNKFEIGQNKDISLGKKISLLYNNSDLTRALVMLLPAGGIVDMFACKSAHQFTQEKVNVLINELAGRLDNIEHVLMSHEDESMFFHLVYKACQNVVTTRSQEKISRFACVLSNSIEFRTDWDETETLLNLVESLTDTHIQILSSICKLDPNMHKEFENMRVVKLVNLSTPGEIPHLQECIQGSNEETLKIYCSDLIAKGLLSDEGIGRWDGKPLQLVRVNDSSAWFLNQIREKFA